ncbi:hypothetical protein FC093_07325 [Ilyomonas limi]|uniref:Uncharacterized protein n=1 Tax=Ilyomonas limi TaxID=2575867 RepID=A0A4U3L653_9BACT|nr:hypothetical protein [Ilyomonas limi]TKK69879.1 hypothetical protein FC093_07325 [Ilyomonas limi]
MANVLAAATKDNTRFTIFENDQVLTADQLNDLFNYLDVQTRLTRTRGLGIGIICGLEIGQLENKQIAVSKGTAITSDGDLLHIDADQAFDRYALFEDNNARYPYFRMDNEQVVTIYQLSSSTTDTDTGDDFTKFEEVTNTLVKDYVGVLYLEDYQNDPDVCTGTDCDNKGAQAVRELKVLLIHKDNLSALLQSIPPLNKNYFALDDIAMPRAIITTAISQYAELNTSFTNTFSIRSEIKEKLVKAYQTCQVVLQDEFDGVDPTSEWNQLLDTHFNIGTSIYAQYVYDFARDLTCAYNEMREVLFGDNMMCCPDVALFPKHVLLGTIRTAAVANDTGGNIPASPPVSLPRPPIFLPPVIGRLRFDIGLLIKRFTPILIDNQYRHSFYESPVLNNKEENMEKIKFCFMRIHSMIHNFKIPTTATLPPVTESIKITPGYFEDQPLGKRSLPFYYDINTNLPANLYWSYDANVRKKENEILSYAANKYASKSSVFSPLSFNILPYTFFRIEGHIGFKYQDVERVLNDLIVNNNLPINLITVQVERDINTIPIRPWNFPYLNLHEAFVRNTLNDHMNQVDLVNSGMLSQISDTETTKPIIASAANGFTNAKNKVLADGAITGTGFNLETYKTDVQNAITSANFFKQNTQQFTFSNTAPPHDFVINTDVIYKADLIDDLFKQHFDQKRQGLMLGNYLAKNPGLEHAGGVLRGGTFVLVYTANDSAVVADFMLPYANIDNDIVPDPIVVKPLPLPQIPQFDVPKLFEKIPTYQKLFKAQLDPIAESLNTTITQTDVKIPPIVKIPINTTADIGNILRNTTGIGSVVFTGGGTTNPADTTGSNPVVNVAGADVSAVLEDFRNKQEEVAKLPADAPDRQAKEQALLQAASALTEQLNKPEVTNNPNNALVVKSILSDVHSSTGLVQTEALKSEAANVTTIANTINRGFNLRQ